MAIKKSKTKVVEDIINEKNFNEPCEKCIKLLANLEKSIEYWFNDKSLLFKAVTHTSYAHENVRENIMHNERLEFLGDSALGLILAEYLFSKYPEKREGKLSLMKSWLESETQLAVIADEINLGSYLFIGVGEEKSNGRKRSALLADAMEAVIGAVYLDGGIEAVEELIFHLFKNHFSNIEKNSEKINFKNLLQMKLQRNGKSIPNYFLVSCKGPAHKKDFVVEVKLGNEVLAQGNGKSKKEAEMNAAEFALELFE